MAFSYQLLVKNVQDRTRLNIRKVLDDYTYTDKRTDLPHKLTLDERDSIAQFFFQTQWDTDWSERDIQQIAERQVRKRLGLK